MNYLLTLKLEKDEVLSKAIKFLESKEEWRANLKILENKDKIVFKIDAKDANALRAQANIIFRLLYIYEKLNKILSDFNI